MIRGFAAILICLAGAAQSETLSFPSNASLQRVVTSDAASHTFPIGIWERGEMPTQMIEGALTQQAWRIATPSLTTLQIMRPLREQLRNDRYRVVFECQTEACGGFDFRFAAGALPPPEMQVNIGDFRFLTAERTNVDGPEMISLMVSRTSQAGFVQITQVTPLTANQGPIAAAQAPEINPASLTTGLELADRLAQTGRAVLTDLNFATGSAQLVEGEYPSLRKLAAYLLANPDITIALVGHTDADGDLDLNIALSKRRAASVLERLAGKYGIPRRQMESEGIGYLAPIASNLTAQGRELNRRVEVVIASARAD